jgi:hypothetical protein
MTRKPTPDAAKPSKPSVKITPKGGVVGDNESLKRELRKIAFRNSQKHSQKGH